MQLKEIHLLSANLSETQQFYSNVLGLEAKMISDKLLKIIAGNSDLYFCLSENTNAFYHFAFNIPETVFDNTLEYYRNSIGTIPVNDFSDIAEFVNWNARSFYFYDNNGNILECITRFDVNPEPFPINYNGYILNISEIGCVSEAVQLFAEERNQMDGIPFFARQPAMPAFSVLGDDQGLLIVVPENRNWYPTQKASVKAFTKVLWEEKGRSGSFEMYSKDLLS